MKPSHRARLLAALFAAALAAPPAALPAAARVFANMPSGAGENLPDSLTPYERRVLRLDYQRLMRELAQMKLDAAETEPSLEAARKKVAAAKEAGDARGAVEARKELDAAADIFVRESPEGARKLKRLGDVGTLLNRDTGIGKEIRSIRHDTSRPAAESPRQ